MRVAAFVATLCLLLAVPSNGVKKKRRTKNDDSEYERRRACQTETCGHLVLLESNNCVNECVSPDCYRKTFKDPLEDGEVNTQLHKNFNACARRERKSTAFTQKRSRKQFTDTKNAAASGSKPGVARKESVVLPTGVLEDNAAEFLVPLDADDSLVEQDGGRLGGGGVLDSEEEEEDGEAFDEEYDEMVEEEGAVL